MRATRRTVLAGLAGLTGCLGAAPRDGRQPLEAGSADARLGFVGDLMLGRSVTDRWEGNESAEVWGATLERLERLDGLVANLECCISDRGQRWPGKTYYFRADPDFAVPALRAAGVSVASLANNHTLDFGTTALADTRSHLADAGVVAVGAGRDRPAAVEPAVGAAGGLTVATVAFTDQWPAYAASEASAGTAHAPLDPAVPSTRRLVGEALDRARGGNPDLVVASLHWGPNWETEPDATQEAFARWLIDRGADVVHGHSAHVLQGVEVYRGRPILYDCGDFVDDYVHKEGLQNKHSALFELVVRDGRLDRLRLVPVEIEREAVHPAGAEAAAWLRETMDERSSAFGTTVERAGEGLSVPLGTQ
jgi:poly-gamma-glutamate capsule biosynthesis protein CapA/YwtB (metallophosphatase superfamily)